MTIQRTSYAILTAAIIALPGTVAAQRTIDPGAARVDSIMQSLSIEEKVGQLIMPWLPGSYTAVNGEAFIEAAQWIEQLGIGGIVISTGTPIAAASKLNSLQLRSRLPLIVTADFEFGVAMRMSGATAFPQPMAIGATGRELDAYQLGRITAIEARAIGVHWTFSPVADLNSNPDNPIINTRSFGETPGRVAPLISAYIQGASDYGLFTTAKHFPGHGDTGVDSHIALPVVAACWERLDSLELAPFRAAIAAGVTSIMTAHVALPCIDDGDNLPATLSPRIMRTVLGDSLGFRGIVVTDALTMGAIVATYGIGESAVKAFLAGSDVLLYPSDPFEAFFATVAAVRSGRIPAQRLDHSVRKLLNLKVQAGLFERRTVPLDSVTSFVGIREHTLIAEDIAARSLTLVQEGALNTFRNRRSRVAVVTYAEETNLRIGNTMVRHLRDLGDTVSTFRIFPASGPLSYDSASVLIAQHERVIFATSVRAVSGRGHIALPSLLADLIQRTNRATPTVLISFGSPYLLRQLGSFDGTFILAWTDVDPAERAVAFALSGGAPITGQLPISLSPTMVRGHGITVPAENR